MAKNERRMVRKPATKYPNLRKKLQKGKLQPRQAGLWVTQVTALTRKEAGPGRTQQANFVPLRSAVREPQSGCATQ